MAHLFEIPNMGIKSVLEFSCSTESAIISAGYAEVKLQKAHEIEDMFNTLDSYIALPWTARAAVARASLPERPKLT